MADLNFGFTDCLLFGAIISATDPGKNMICAVYFVTCSQQLIKSEKKLRTWKTKYDVKCKKYFS